MINTRGNINKEKSNFIILFVVSLGLIILDGLGILSPVRALSDTLSSPVKNQIFRISAVSGDVWHLANNFKEEKLRWEKNERLKKELLTLKSDVKRLKLENESLRKQLEAPLPSSWKFQPAAVLGISRYMQIWAGSDEGIMEGMSVVSGKIYIGRTNKVFPKISLVTLPSDPEAKIPAISSRGTRGIVMGSFGEKILFDQVLQKDPLFIDDQIETTGEDGYAPGVIIGKVDKVEANDFEVYKKGEIKVLMSPYAETTVFIVKEF